MQYDVFISYNRTDERFVEYLEEILRLAPLRVFRDVTGLGVYDKLDAALKTAIANSRWLMAIISSSYLQSYWCLFEALEAIQGQDVDLRFLPIVLRYSPDDQSFDEEFVFNALADLREQMHVLEAQIVSSRAFSMSTKLDKLAFVQNHLPKIFVQMQERVYPQFQMWDEKTVRSNMRDLVRYLAPTARVDINAVPFSPGEPRQATPVVTPRLSQLPILIWKAEVGCQAWRNTPVVVGNDVIVPSSGRIWNQPDDRDGIVCLHAETGNARWFAAAPADSNCLLVSKGLAITGCDDGTLLAIRLSDGQRQWELSLGAAVIGGPLRKH